MSSSLSLLSAVAAGFGLLLSGPFGPAPLPKADMDELRNRAAPAYVARIRDAGGRELGEVFRDGPLASPLALLPESFVKAVIAIEDRRFFEHDGIDPIGLAGALASQFGSNPRGGSTIDQQMAKNAWTGPEESLRRKVAEAVLALRARHLLGAEGVLQAYLETAWFGRGVTGAAGAAQAWFGRDWAELSLGEVAYLAGMLKGPGFYDASRHPERAIQRRDQVLAAMLREGFIDDAEAEAARAEQITPAPRPRVGQGVENRWFLTAARPEIGRAIDDSPAWQSLFARVDIDLTLSSDWQAIAQSALRSGVRSMSAVEPFAVLDADALSALREARESEPETLRRLARAHLAAVLPWDSDAQAAILLSREGEGDEWTVVLSNGELRTAPLHASGNLTLRPGQVLALRTQNEGFAAAGRNTIEGAVVVLDPRDGSLLASVGGADPSLTAFDRTRARRQPGSAIKTFLWLAALESGFHVSSPVPDFEQDYFTESGEIWRPRNYGRTQSGMIPLAAAYERSSNLAAAALINTIGSDAMARMAEQAGAYPRGMPRHLSAALGTIELTLLDLTRAHAAVVNGGVPRDITVVRDMRVDGQQMTPNGMWARQGFGAAPIASHYHIEDMLGMMRGVVRNGTGAPAFRDHPVIVAGKTGTSQDHRDAWFIAVTPHVAVGVWLGRDDDRSMGGRATGGRYAAPVAAQILADAHRAGLIDAEGYRDTDRALAIAWPPVRHTMQAAHGADPFLGVVMEPIQVPAPVEPPRVNRGTVSRHDHWERGGVPAIGGQVRPGAR